MTDCAHKVLQELEALGLSVDHVKCKISGMTGWLASGLETGC